MAGGLMQLVAYGAQDIYLTGNPQITFFKVVYRRHSNFAMENIEQQFSGSVNFNRRVTCIIARSGDLITKTYVRAVLPQVDYSGSPANQDLVKFAWVKRLGHALVADSYIEIGGSQIDKIYGDWINIWYEFTRKNEQDRGYDEMIGNTDDLTALSVMTSGGSTVVKPQKTLYIPMTYWFCRNNGLALPLIALQYHEVRIHVNFRPVEQLYVSNQYFVSAPIVLNDASLLVDYIYLDTEERRRFAQISHEYLIEQLQFTGAESMSNNSQKYKLTYNHPSKALFWAMKMGNFQGHKFLDYQHKDWSLALANAAKIVSLGALDVDVDTGLLINPYAPANNITLDPNNQYTRAGHLYTAYDLTDLAAAVDLRLNVVNDAYNPIPSNAAAGTFGIGVLDNASKVLALSSSTPDYLSLVSCRISISYYNDVVNNIQILVAKVIDVLSNSLQIQDISIPIDKFGVDNRNQFSINQDLTVWQHDNYGVYIDGSVNPVHSALLQLNGQDRFTTRSGSYFNYVQPYQHFCATPKDGINLYSFALKPEEHQPSGTCNFSRIDTTQLNLVFVNQFAGSDAPYFQDPDNLVYIYTINYNVLRIMSGMGGLAYSN